jgi:phosphogluconate dehydratase
VNHFHAAGGMGYLISQLLGGGFLHNDVDTVMGRGLDRYQVEPWLNQGRLDWRPVPAISADADVLRPVSAPFSQDGGLRLLRGNIGRAVIKVSAVKPQHQVVRAPAVVVTDQAELARRYKDGLLERDFVAVVRNQGPQANGMPELHKLTPLLGVLQDRGFKVALVTDGRMSGASGKVPAAIHVSPEAVDGGMIARIQEGDIIRLDCIEQALVLEVSDRELEQRVVPAADLSANQRGTGRDLFALFRHHAASAEEGASPLLGHL